MRRTYGIGSGAIAIALTLCQPLAPTDRAQAATTAAPHARAHAPATHAIAPAATPAAPVRRPAVAAGATGASDDSSLTLKGGEEGTVFRSLTVEGEDRIHYDFERPPLTIALDPSSAPGLDWGTARDVLDRTRPDEAAPLVAWSARAATRGVGEPWRRRFADGAVARFHPALKGVERWKLTVADARGEAVAVFDGHGEPPAEIAWDGHTTGGGVVTPGLTYSYVFEAVDRAGNKRHFLGDPFRVSAFRMQTPAGVVLAFSGHDLLTVPDWRGASNGDAPPAALVAEAASWLDQAASVRTPLRLTATARTRDQAERLATLAQHGIAPLLLGDPARLLSASEVRADAPEDGAVRIEPAH